MKHFRKKSLAMLTALTLSASALAACAPTAALKAVEANYPVPAAEEKNAQTFAESQEYQDWLKFYQKKIALSEPYQTELRGYYRSLLPKLLNESDDNTVCSPLNIYIALGMLAEVSDGENRQQILNALEASDIEVLRSRITALWESNYVDTPLIKSLLADSLWLNNSVSYNEETLERLAKIYYASSFCGKPGSAEMDEALRKWTDQNTGGLLTDYTKNLKLEPETVLALVSTIYYKAAWVDEFYAAGNTRETFHGTKGDATVDMMHQTDTMGIMEAEKFTAVRLPLKDSGDMYFYLPKEGVAVNELTEDEAVLDALPPTDTVHWTSYRVNLTLPKFKVSEETDLTKTLAAMGITDAMDGGKANFKPLTEAGNHFCLTRATHAAMVEVDEQGVTGAAYTMLAMAGAAMQMDEPLDLTFDRPFLFLVTAEDGSLLFSGVVRNIE